MSTFLKVVYNFDKKVKIYQVYQHPTTQFIHGPIFGYDILVILKVGCTFLSLKQKGFILLIDCVLFEKNKTLTFQIEHFCFCTAIFFLFICKNVLIIGINMHIINSFLHTNKKNLYSTETKMCYLES